MFYCPTFPTSILSPLSKQIPHSAYQYPGEDKTTALVIRKKLLVGVSDELIKAIHTTIDKLPSWQQNQNQNHTICTIYTYRFLIMHTLRP